MLGACTSALRGLAESTAKPGGGHALSWSWQAQLGHLLGDCSEEPVSNSLVSNRVCWGVGVASAVQNNKQA